MGAQSAARVTIGNGIDRSGRVQLRGRPRRAECGHDLNSSASGNVTGGINSFIGGLVGQNGIGGSASITNASASGNVSGGGTSGGLVGYNANNASITASSATGNVSGTSTISTVGGLVGQNEGRSSQSSRTGGTISGAGRPRQNVLLGGLVGNNNGPGVIQTSTTSGVTINGTSAAAGGFELPSTAGRSPA